MSPDNSEWKWIIISHLTQKIFKKASQNNLVKERKHVSTYTVRQTAVPLQGFNCAFCGHKWGSKMDILITL